MPVRSRLVVGSTAAPLYLAVPLFDARGSDSSRHATAWPRRADAAPARPRQGVSLLRLVYE